MHRSSKEKEGMDWLKRKRDVPQQGCALCLSRFESSIVLISVRMTCMYVVVQQQGLLPGTRIVFKPAEDTILTLLSLWLSRVMRNTELVGDGIFECEEGGVGRRGGSTGAGYVPTDDLCNDFSGDMGKVVEGGDGGAPRPNEGMAVGMLFVLGFR